MKSLFLKFVFIILLATFTLEGASAGAYSRYNNYRYKNSSYSASYNYREPEVRYVYLPVANTPSCTNFSNANVGVSNISDGVNISVISYDGNLQNCIKNTSWLTYFTRFGNSVNVRVSETTLGVQILATSYNSSIASNLQNAGWNAIITGNGYYQNTNYNNQYNQYNTYQPYAPTNTYYNTYTPTYAYDYTPPTPVYTEPPRGYISGNYPSGTSVFGGWIRSTNRSLATLSNGVRMTFTSPEYTTATYFQNYFYTDLFTSRLIGISVKKEDVPGGVQVTVTSGNSSTIREIQSIGYALVYQ